jgi:hypothetical protein
MNCIHCKAEWTPPIGVSITQCPFCGKPLVEIKDSDKNAEPHEILLKIVHQYDRKKLGDILLKGMLSDLMPRVEKKYQRVFKQALDDKIGAKLLELEDEKDSIRIVKINTLKDSFKNNNGFDKTADYVVDCFLFALGWIETVNKELYSQGEFDKLSVVSQQIDMAFIDGVLHREEANALFSNAQKLGLAGNQMADLIKLKIESLNLKPYPDTPKSLKNLEEIICSSDWYSDNKSKTVHPSYLNEIFNKCKTDGYFTKFESFDKFKDYFHDEATYKKLWDFLNSKDYKVLSYPDFIEKITGKRSAQEKKNQKSKKEVPVKKTIPIEEDSKIKHYADGSSYEGDLVDGQKHGDGKYTYNNGDTYDGEWLEDKRNGMGVYTYSTGQVDHGFWEDDEMIIDYDLSPYFIFGQWQGGAFDEVIVFGPEDDNLDIYYATCLKNGTNKTSNAFKKNQKLFEQVQIPDENTISGQILVPMQSGSQEWYDFTGSIDSESIHVTIGPHNWQWSYRKISY